MTGGISLETYVGGRTPRILIVDDEPINLKVLAAHLTRWGCTVQAVASGSEALEAVGTFHPDLILLDVMMPDLSGLDVCRMLQADPATAAVPIIFLTAVAGEQAMVKGLAAGARDYVTKPFVAADLAARVGAQLKQRYAQEDRPIVEGRLAP
jgi:DNA-binding response OmpR family regulator